MLTAAGDVPSLATLRAASNDDYIVPRTNSRLGDRAFSVAAPRAWNHRLPADLKTASCSTDVLKRRLKTFLLTVSTVTDNIIVVLCCYRHQSTCRRRTTKCLLTLTLIN